MAELGTAYINIVPKAEGIKGKLENIVKGSTSGSGGIGMKIAKGIGNGLVSGVKLGFAGIAAAGALTGKLLADSFAAGGDLEQSFGGLETLYGEAAAGAKEYAMAAAQAGISANSYAEQAVSFGAALKKAYGGDTAMAMEAANTAIMDMADNAAKMGTPIESIQQTYQGFAKQNYTMLDNLKLGYGGTKEEMERLLKDAQALSGVEYDIENLGDVYDAIHVIQEDLGLTGVAAEEAKTTLVGSANATKAAWTNVLAALSTGQGLETAMDNFSEAAENLVNNILRMLGTVAPQMPAFLAGIGSAIVAAAPEIAPAAAEIAAQLLVTLIQAIPQILTFLPMLFETLKTALSGLDWLAIGSDIINGIVNGLWAAASFLWDALLGILNFGIDQLKAFLGIASPSKRFAREIGHWIPPGIGMGAEDNIRSLDAPLGRVANYGLSVMRRAAAPGMTVVGTSALDLDRLLDYEEARPVEVTVVLQGDAKEVFKVVKTYNTVRTKATHYNALAARR